MDADYLRGQLDANADLYVAADMQREEHEELAYEHMELAEGFADQAYMYETRILVIEDMLGDSGGEEESSW